MEQTFKIIGHIDLSKFEKYTPEFKAKEVHLKFLSTRLTELEEQRDSIIEDWYYEPISHLKNRHALSIRSIEQDIEDLESEYDSLKTEIFLTRQIN